MEKHTIQHILTLDEATYERLLRLAIDWNKTVDEVIKGLIKGGIEIIMHTPED